MEPCSRRTAVIGERHVAAGTAQASSGIGSLRTSVWCTWLT